MIPAFLSEYKAEIEKYRLETIKIIAKSLADEGTLPIKQSKFLGTPFLPIHTEYPKDKKDIPMILLAQINFEEIPALENYPTKGILQIFISAADWLDMEDYCILFHENTNQECQTDFSFLISNLFEESPIYCEHKLSFTKQVDYGGVNDFRFDLEFEGKEYYDFQETLPKDKQQELDNFFYGAGHKIGGYAFFTQSDPRENSLKNRKDDVLLLQIDTDEKIMFGDSGVANVFISINDLLAKKFDKAYFNWDCC